MVRHVALDDALFLPPRLRAVDGFEETRSAAGAQLLQPFHVGKGGARLHRQREAGGVGEITVSRTSPDLMPSPGTPNALYW